MLSIELQAPRFEDDGSSIQRVSAPRTHLLTRLGYKNGKMTQRNNSIVYRQKAYGKVSCEVALKWNSPAPQVLEGSYCITTQGTWYSETIQAADFMKEYAKNFQTALVEHTNWWNTYWEKVKFIYLTLFWKTNGIWKCTSSVPLPGKMLHPSVCKPYGLLTTGRLLRGVVIFTMT